MVLILDSGAASNKANPLLHTRGLVNEFLIGGISGMVIKCNEEISGQWGDILGNCGLFTALNHAQS